jgi:hypothetical protein
MKQGHQSKHKKKDPNERDGYSFYKSSERIEERGQSNQVAKWQRKRRFLRLCGQ